MTLHRRHRLCNPRPCPNFAVTTPGLGFGSYAGILALLFPDWPLHTEAPPALVTAPGLGGAMSAGRTAAARGRGTGTAFPSMECSVNRLVRRRSRVCRGRSVFRCGCCWSGWGNCVGDGYGGFSGWWEVRPDPFSYRPEPARPGCARRQSGARWVPLGVPLAVYAGGWSVFRGGRVSWPVSVQPVRPLPVVLQP